MPDTITAKQLARQLGITPRQFRQFLRTRSSSYAAVGRGKRYEFPIEECNRVKAEYHYWRRQVKAKKEKQSMLLGSESQHHPRKYATGHRDEVIFVFSCCAEQKSFRSRRARDKAAADHEVEYKAKHRIKPKA